MRILLTGATGMIGSALVERFMRDGHDVILVVREPAAVESRWPGAHLVRGAFGDDIEWADHLRDVDVVINAAGRFGTTASQMLDAVHVKGPVELFRAAARTGVRRVVQISALGADPTRTEPHLSTKGRADAELSTLPIRSTIVRPSLVFSVDSPSTQWFAALALLPLTPLPGGGGQRMQPVHLDDLCDAISRVATMPDPPAYLDAVGPRDLALRDYLATLKRQLGARGGLVGVPAWLLDAASRVFGRFSAWLSPASLSMLAAGSAASADGITRVLGREPRDVATFVHAGNRERLRIAAALQWLCPLLRVCLIALWIVTGLVSAFVYPRQASLELLARTGLHGPAASVALYGAAALDIVLGAMLLRPAWRRLSYNAQMLLIAFYTVVITWCLPEYWAHPYGPILKNLPLLAAIALARELDAPRGRHHR